jgi:hypothetical protein
MQKMAITICLLLVSVLSVKSFSDELDTYSIHYVPFDLHTLLPITPDDDALSGDPDIGRFSSSTVSLIFDALKTSPSSAVSMNGYNIRILVTREKDQRALYITQQLQVLSEGREYRIDKAAIGRAVSVIESEINARKGAKSPE